MQPGYGLDPLPSSACVAGGPGRLTAQKTTLDERRGQEDEARRTAVAEREALQEKDAYKNAVTAMVNARQLAEQATRAETTADRSEQRAGQAQAAVFPAQQRLKSAEEKLEAAERTVAALAAKVTVEAADAGLTDVTVRHCRSGTPRAFGRRPGFA